VLVYTRQIKTAKDKLIQNQETAVKAAEKVEKILLESTNLIINVKTTQKFTLRRS